METDHSPRLLTALAQYVGLLATTPNWQALTHDLVEALCGITGADCAAIIQQRPGEQPPVARVAYWERPTEHCPTLASDVEPDTMRLIADFVACGDSHPVLSEAIDRGHLLGARIAGPAAPWGAVLLLRQAAWLPAEQQAILALAAAIGARLALEPFKLDQPPAWEITEPGEGLTTFASFLWDVREQRLLKHAHSLETIFETRFTPDDPAVRALLFPPGFDPDDFPGHTTDDARLVRLPQRRLTLRDGRTRVVDCTLQLQYDDQRRPARIFGMVQDVTRRTVMAQRYQTVIDTVSDAFYAITPYGAILDVNQASCEMLGYTRDELLAMNVWDVNGTRDAIGRSQEQLQRVQREGRIVFETEHRRKDGSNIDVEISASFQRDLQQVFAFCRDITAWKAAERSLIASEALYRSMVENQADLVLRLDGDLNVTFVSRTYCDLFQQQPTDLLGRNFYDSIYDVHPDDQGNTTQQTARLLSPPYTARIVHRARTPLGWRWLSWSDKALVDSEGNLTGVVAVGRDVTEEKLYEAQLEKTLEGFVSSNEALREVAYVASHDLQEPLRTVSSFLQLLKRRFGDQLPPEATEYVDWALDGSERMRALIRDLLSYSRLTSQPAAPQVVDLNAVLEGARNSLAHAIDEAQASITADPLPQVALDPTRAVQLMQNVLSNAIKYRGDEPPRVHVSAATEGDLVKICVQDNGIGIAPAFHEAVFAPFRRLHTREEYSGTGIGLATCRRIVEMAGGRIWLDSAPGAGTTVCFTLPTANAPPPAATSDSRR